MSILTANGLAKSYGAQDVFWDVSLRIGRGDKVALIGPNGHGKSTLLQLLAGLDTPTAGRVHRARGLRIGWLPQHPDLPGERTLYDEMLTVFADLQTQQAELRELERAMADPARREGVLARYGQAQTRFEMAGGYTYESRIRRVLGGLGFREEEHQLPISHLSGGQKTRALLARLLLEEPDLLLLDEPTNYLDLAALEWLEGYLVEWPGSLVVVAHDRYFLDRVVSRVWELAFGRLEEYPGNYSRYVELRAERMARRLTEYQAQQEHIQKTEEFIRRYKAGQRHREARGRQKRLDRLERLEQPRELRTMRLSMPVAPRSGDLVLATSKLVVGHRTDDGDLRLFSCPDLDLRRGERAALIGPNASGKTTLIHTILGHLPPLAGEVRLGASLRVGYLAQAVGDDGLDSKRTILDEILDVENLPLEKARGFLGRFLFSGDEVFKPIGDLSGGERMRVALAKLTLTKPNFLVLDEPTTHLDIASQEVLQEVLSEFDGTILFVSHDRYLIEALATQVWAIEGPALSRACPELVLSPALSEVEGEVEGQSRRVEGGTLHVHRGRYSEYIAEGAKREKSGERGEPALSKVEGSRGLSRAQSRDREEKRRGEERLEKRERERQVRRRAELEDAIAGLENRLAALAGELTAASAAQDVARLTGLGTEYAQVEEELHRLVAEWEGLGVG
jgi:ATP-binding cassette subfamily F protein 3